MSRLCRLILPSLPLLGLVALLSSPAPAANPPAPPQKIVSIEGITEYRLDNGLRVLLFPDVSSSTVTVNLTVFVGSRHEGYGETGMAHLLEHMVFKGTPTHPDVPKALKDHGASFNGTTWVDRTNYFETMPATDANLEFGIRLEADRLVNSHVKREDLVSEMTVVRNEFEMGENDPENILSQRMMANAYEWHNYGKSTIGNRSDIERVPIDSLQAFYRKHYQPDNCMLVVAGKFDEAKALAYITKYFGALKRPERKLDMTYTEEPAQDGERVVVLRRVGKIGVIGAIYHIPAGSHPDFPAVQVLNHIMVSEPSGRLYKALVPTKKATSVAGAAYGWHDPGVLEYAVQLDAKNAVGMEKVRDEMVDVLEKLATEKPTAEEVERAKRKLLKDRELLLTRSNRIGIELSEWGAKGDWRLFFLNRDQLEKVTPADVARVAGQYLKRSNRTVGLFIPADKADRTDIPERPKVDSLVKNYRGRQDIAQGEAFNPTPENIEARVQRSELPSGVKVALLPKKTRGEAVHLSLTLRYGNENSLRGLTSASQFVGTLMTRSTKQHNRQQLQDELDRLKARVTVSRDSLIGKVGFNVETKRATLPAVLALLGEILRSPTFPADEFDILRRERRDALEKDLTDPQALAVRALQRKLNPYPPEDVRYTPTVQESIARLEAVTNEQVRRIYEEQFGGQVGELAVVGDFDPAGTIKQLQDVLNDWKAPTPYERITRPAHTDVKGGRESIHTPDKENALYFAGEMLALTDDDPAYPGLKIASYLFGEGSLSSRLGNRVRQKEGLSYGVGSRFEAEAKDKSARFSMYAIFNPKVVERVDAVIGEELQKLLKEGPGAEELEEAKNAYLELLKVQRASDASLAGLLEELLYEGRTFAYYIDLEKKIKALTPTDVAATFRKHIDPKRLVIVRAGDFQKQGAKAK